VADITYGTTSQHSSAI